MKRSSADPEEARFRAVFRAAHAAHARCADDEWLNAPCADDTGRAVDRPLVWSRRNGPWRRSAVLWVGAAPGNAGGLGSGALGAHATRIPFGGDIAGGNLDVLLGALGTDRNHTFITASLNQLPARGGGEPTGRELAEPVGDYPDSVALLRDTIIAAGPRLIVALGNVALRMTAAAITRASDALPGQPLPVPGPLRLPALPRLADAGLRRGVAAEWPGAVLPPAGGFLNAWSTAWGVAPVPAVLQVLHPSAQNMSPFAGEDTIFHRRMLDTLSALRSGAAAVLGRQPPAERTPPPPDGIYALPEWRELVAPAHARYDALWRGRGI
jgi:hypothetical protein